MKIPFDVAVAATGAAVFGFERAPSYLRVVTDTRAIEPGDTFLALRGERFDGHHFVEEAVAKGAVAVVIEDSDVRPPSRTALVVEDCLRAYMALAGAFSGSPAARARRRRRSSPRSCSRGATATAYLRRPRTRTTRSA